MEYNCTWGECFVMNAILGARIRSLRLAKGLTQEEIADQLNCSRQKYARIEKGLIDISYASLTKIAQILNVKVEEITSAVNDTAQEQLMFRGSSSDDKFAFIADMIDTFYAHRRLYYSVRQDDENE